MRLRWRQLATLLVVAALPALLIPFQAHAAVAYYSLSRLRVSETATVVARWNPCQEVITYRINAAVSASTATGRSAAIADTKTAVAKLAYATGLRFRYLGSTSRTPTGYLWWQHLGDAELVIAWVDQSQSSHRSDLLQRSSKGWLAGTGGWHAWRWGTYAGYRAGAAVVRGFVVLNAQQRSYFASDFSSGITRGELLLHELGHVVGLGHVSYRSQLMYPLLIWRSQTRYFSGDLAGLRLLGRSAGCIAIPKWANAPADLPQGANTVFTRPPRKLLALILPPGAFGSASGVSLD